MARGAARGAVLRTREPCSCVRRKRPVDPLELLKLRPVVAALLGRLAAVDRLELLEAAAGTDSDAGQRALRDVHGHLRLVTEPLVEAVQERAAAGEDDAAVHDVGRELGRR